MQWVVARGIDSRYNQFQVEYNVRVLTIFSRTKHTYIYGMYKFNGVKPWWTGKYLNVFENI